MRRDSSTRPDRRALAASALAAALACGCQSGPEPVATEGPLAGHARAVALAAGVPGDLLLAIAHVEDGLRLPRWRTVEDDDDDHVPVAGILELRRGRVDTLALGAELVGLPERTLREDTDLGTEAGALVLATLGRETGARPGDPASYAQAVARLSGLREGPILDAYVAAVFALLRAGGEVPARDGEVVVIPPHPEVPAALTLVDPGLVRAPLGVPEFPGATWFDTPCGGKCADTRGVPVDTIVLHSTEGGWVGSVATLQNDPGKSVHYIIDKDGSRVGQFIPESYTGWHAGNSCWNKKSIGIEHVGYAADPAGFAAPMYAKTVELVQSIRTRHAVPLDRQHVVGHYQIPDGTRIDACGPACAAHLSVCEKSPDYGGASNHTDPGLFFQWCQLMDKLGGRCTCEDAWSHWNCTTDKTMAVRCAGGQVELLRCAPCESRPVGEDDVCTPPRLPDLGAQPAVDAGTGDLATGGPVRPPIAAPLASTRAGASGCATAGTGARRPVPAGPGSLLVLVALAALARRRRASR